MQNGVMIRLGRRFNIEILISVHHPAAFDD